MDTRRRAGEAGSEAQGEGGGEDLAAGIEVAAGEIVGLGDLGSELGALEMHVCVGEVEAPALGLVAEAEGEEALVGVGHFGGGGA